MDIQNQKCLCIVYPFAIFLTNISKCLILWISQSQIFCLRDILGISPSATGRLGILAAPSDPQPSLPQHCFLEVSSPLPSPLSTPPSMAFSPPLSQPFSTPFPFLTHPGRIGRLVLQVLRWACCARATHHDVWLVLQNFQMGESKVESSRR